MAGSGDMPSTSGIALVREREGRRDVFVSRRPDDRGFLAGFHGFFIGRAEEGDAEIPLSRDGPFRVPGRDAWGCAARELFEEAGLLPLESGLVVTWRDENPVEAPGESWSAVRRSVARGDAALGEALRRAGYRVDAGAFEPVGEWQTPSWSSYDTRTEFFVCSVSFERCDDLSAHVEVDEHRDPRWESPEQILERWRRGTWFLSTPIRFVIQGLAGDYEFGDGLLLPPIAEQTRNIRETIEVLQGLRMLPLRTPTLPPANHTNCSIIGGSRLLVVDPGSDLPGERDLLESLLWRLIRRGARLEAVVLTHHHEDHVEGVSGLRRSFDVEVWAHAETADRLAGTIDVDRELEDRERLEVDGDHPLRLLHTPGHAPGHLAVFHEPSRVLLAGDLVASRGTILIDPDDGDMGAYLESLARVDALDLRAILPAHGQLIPDPHGLLQQYRDHRWEREAKVLAALRDAGRPATPDDLVSVVYADKPTSVWPIAVRSLESHLLHLVERGLARRVGDRFQAVDESA